MNDYQNYKEDMNRAFQGDPNEFMNSLKDEDYKKYIHKKYELILQFFDKIDTNKDGMLSYNELVTFLDTNMNVFYNLKQNGKKFDKETADKIMKLLDSDNNGKISL
jgi:Ca2+-binding EF-hand superfamily protein